MEVQDRSLWRPVEIDLRAIGAALFRQKHVVALFTAVCVAAAYVATFLTPAIVRATAVVSVSFKSAAEQSYPSGAPFSESDLTAPPVLVEVIRQLQLGERGVSVDALQRALSLEPLFRQEKVAAGGTRQVPLYQYRLRLSPIPNTALPAEAQSEILSVLVETYRQMRRGNLAGQQPFPSFNGSTGDAMLDYPLIEESIREYLKRLSTVVTENANRARYFRSAASGRSFGELARKVDLLLATDVVELSTLVTSYHLTRDRERALNRYRNQIRDFELAESQRRLETELARSLLTDARSMRNLEFGSGIPPTLRLDAKDPLAESVTKLYKENYYPKLVEEVIRTGTATIVAKARIDLIKQEVQRLESARTLAEMGPIVAQADRQIMELIEKSEALTAAYNEVLLQYHGALAKGLVSFVEPPKLELGRQPLSRNLLMGLGVGVVGGLILAYVIAVGWGEGNRGLRAEP